MGSNHNTNEVSRTRQNAQDGKKGESTLNNLIKSSTDPKVQELRGQIEELKKKRAVLVARMRESQYRLGYKTAEKEAIAKLVEMERQKAKSSHAKENMVKLKRLRHSIEFKISTESLSLAQERAMAMKIGEINAQIEEALKLERLTRKHGLVSGDIEKYQKTLNEVVTQITELDGKLDVLYAGIRSALGIQKRRPKSQVQAPKQKQQSQEINLEDIVVIKKKEDKQSSQ